ncbi:hypothetical protein LTR08_006398 [Meristemomyces frigidus]|nr:hypothetical protein LTR08_006398 [Meristemomyces frigidus]
MLLLALTGALLATHTLAHMQLTYPPPFNATNNPHRTTPFDPYLQYPYDCCGPHARWTYPCRGYLALLNTPQGAPTATWPAGTTQTWNMSGIGNHYGGSCQVGFSTNHGADFRVATSYEGNCPHRNAGDGAAGQNFAFKVPDDLELGVQVFAWIWYNREQEFNMNCAAVNITAPTSPSPGSSGLASYGASPSTSTSPAPASSAPTYTTANNCTCACPTPLNIATCTCSCPSPNNNNNKRQPHHHLNPHNHNPRNPTPPSSIPFPSRPLMLVADDGNGCLTPKTTAEAKFPLPGPDVVAGDGVYPLELPRGECGSDAGVQGYDGSSGEDGHVGG